MMTRPLERPTLDADTDVMSSPRHTPRKAVAIAAAVLLVSIAGASPAAASSHRKPVIDVFAATAFPELDRITRVEPGHRGIIRGPGRKAQRRTVGLDVYLDGHWRTPIALSESGCTALFRRGPVEVLVRPCGRVLRADVTLRPAASSRHRVRLKWTLARHR